MSIWDELTPEERAVLTNALEEAGVNNVIGDFLGHAEAGGAIWIGCTDDDTIRPYVPRFAAIVKDMVNRDLIQVFPSVHYDDWPDVPPMTAAELDAALADPAT